MSSNMYSDEMSVPPVRRHWTWYSAYVPPSAGAATSSSASDTEVKKMFMVSG